MTLAPAAPAWRYTRAQLHGAACIVCGLAEEDVADSEALVGAGHIYTEGTEPGSRLGWAARACPRCATALDSPEREQT